MSRVAMEEEGNVNRDGERRWNIEEIEEEKGTPTEMEEEKQVGLY